MIKKINSSLLVKVFLIPSIMLLFVSLLVFFLLAWLMPQTYLNKLNTILDQRTQDFIAELEQATFSESGGLFDQFVQDMEINFVELYNSNGDAVPLPTGKFDNKWVANIAQAEADDFRKAVPVLSSSYHFYWKCNQVFPAWGRHLDFCTVRTWAGSILC